VGDCNEGGFALLAQRSERWSYEPKVLGSNPRRGIVTVFIVAAKALCVVGGRGLWDARFCQIPFGILSMLHVRGTLSWQRDGLVEPVGFTMAKYPVAAFLAW
jgi:hypothetical protein